MRPILLAALLLAGCTVNRAVGPGYTLPRERAAECAQNCAALDMRLAAVVLVLSSAGCVCEPREAGAPRAGGAAAVAGGAVITAVEQQQSRGTTGAPLAPVVPVAPAHR